MTIIIEGLDNTGKSTVINSLKANYPSVNVIHCSKPEGSTSEEQAANQDKFFINAAMDCSPSVITIFDRAWYGEYVYGQLYRQRDPDNIIDMIHTAESMLDQDDTYFILLNVNDAQFSVSHDDGNSISEANIEKINKEKKLFEEIFSKSNLKNKKMIYVDHNLEFRSRESIMSNVYSLIKTNQQNK